MKKYTSDFSPTLYGIKYNYLYEVLATTYSYNSVHHTLIPNTASMGIRFRQDNHFEIAPYPSTHTHKNLKQIKIVVLNFVSNVYLYALASLKKVKDSKKSARFPLTYYDYLNDSDFKELKTLFKNNSIAENVKIPYVKTAWGIVICRIVNEQKVIKKSQFDKISLTKFKLKPLYSKILSSSFNLINRAENIALEMIILATRLILVDKSKDKELFSNIYTRINEYKKDLKRFSMNKEVIKTIKLIEEYI